MVQFEWMKSVSWLVYGTIKTPDVGPTSRRMIQTCRERLDDAASTEAAHTSAAHPPVWCSGVPAFRCSGVVVLGALVLWCHQSTAPKRWNNISKCRVRLMQVTVIPSNRWSSPQPENQSQESLDENLWNKISDQSILWGWTGNDSLLLRKSFE